MSKRTLFLIFALFIITSVLLMVALYKPSNSIPAQTALIPKESVAQTTLLFGQPVIATSSSVTNLAYSLPISITTGKNKVKAVQLELQYDPKILAQIVVTPGSFFQNPQVLLNQIDAKTGRISYAIGVGLTAPGVIGKGVMANLTFNSLSAIPQATSIIFLPKTLVIAEGFNQSVLKTTNVGLFTVGIPPVISPSYNSSPSAR